MSTQNLHPTPADRATRVSLDLSVSTCAASPSSAYTDFLSLVTHSSLICEVLGGNALTFCGHLGALQRRLLGQETSVPSPSH